MRKIITLNQCGMTDEQVSDLKAHQRIALLMASIRTARDEIQKLVPKGVNRERLERLDGALSDFRNALSDHLSWIPGATRAVYHPDLFGLCPECLMERPHHADDCQIGFPDHGENMAITVYDAEEGDTAKCPQCGAWHELVKWLTDDADEQSEALFFTCGAKEFREFEAVAFMRPSNKLLAEDFLEPQKRAKTA